MSSRRISVSENAFRQLSELARESGTTVRAVLEKVIDQERRRVLIQLTNESYARLRRNAAAWAEELEERRLSECTLADSLEGD